MSKVVYEASRVLKIHCLWVLILNFCILKVLKAVLQKLTKSELQMV